MSRKSPRSRGGPPNDWAPAESSGPHSSDAWYGAGESELPEADEDDDEDEEVAARVLVGTIADMGPWIPEPIARRHAERPVWFHLAAYDQLVGVFDRYPEGPMAGAETSAILAGLRAFSLDQSSELQAILGVTQELRYGFHVDASLEDVVESFEDDGFEVLEAVRAGRVTLDG